VIPALDEEAALPSVLAEIPRAAVELVLVVDNGSRDRTAEVARAGGAVVVREERRGYGRACLTGLDVLFGRRQLPELPGWTALAGADVVVFLDADHSDHPEELPELVAPIASGEADFVLGSRVLGGAGRRALLPQARFGNALACWLLRVCFGARHTDLGPFRAIRADALQHLRMRDEDYGWTIEMQLKARAARMVVLERPARYRPRIGTSKITGTLAGSLRAGFKILGWILAWRCALCLPRRRIPRFLRSGSSGC